MRKKHDLFECNLVSNSNGRLEKCCPWSSEILFYVLEKPVPSIKLRIQFRFRSQLGSVTCYQIENSLLTTDVKLNLFGMRICVTREIERITSLMKAPFKDFLIAVHLIKGTFKDKEVTDYKLC